MKILLIKSRQGLDRLTKKICEILKKNSRAIFFKLLKIETEIILPTFFYKASITIIHKPSKYTTKKKITGQYS